MKLLLKRIGMCVAVLCCIVNQSVAEVVVVVSPKSPLTELSAYHLSDIYLGRTTLLPDRSRVIPLDQAENASLRNAFYMKFTGRAPEQIKAHWSKSIFTGKGVPPKEYPDSNAVKRAIARNPSAMGYIDSSEVDATVKVLQIVVRE